MLVETPEPVMPTAVKSDMGEGDRGREAVSHHLSAGHQKAEWLLVPTWFLKKAPDSTLQPLLPCLRKLGPPLISFQSLSGSQNLPIL